MFAIPDGLAEAARAIPHLRLLVLHGSRVRGTAHERSDWDFAYLGEEGLDPDRLLIALIDGVGSDRVDAADLGRAGALLRYRVARDGVLVHEAAAHTFARFRLEAIRTWCDMEPVLSRAYDQVLKELGQPR